MNGVELLARLPLQVLGTIILRNFVEQSGFWVELLLNHFCPTTSQTLLQLWKDLRVMKSYFLTFS